MTKGADSGFRSQKMRHKHWIHCCTIVIWGPPVPEVSVMASGTLLAREATITCKWCLIDKMMTMSTNQADICTPLPPVQVALLRLDPPQCPSSPKSIAVGQFPPNFQPFSASPPPCRGQQSPWQGLSRCWRAAWVEKIKGQWITFPEWMKEGSNKHWIGIHLNQPHFTERS